MIDMPPTLAAVVRPIEGPNILERVTARARQARPTASLRREATCKLSAPERALLVSILHDRHRPNAVLFFLEDAFVTPRGWMGAGVGDQDLVGRLTDSNLMGVVYGEAHRYLDDSRAHGYVKVTEAGLRALETGRYEAWSR